MLRKPLLRESQHSKVYATSRVTTQRASARRFSGICLAWIVGNVGMCDLLEAADAEGSTSNVHEVTERCRKTPPGTQPSNTFHTFSQPAAALTPHAGSEGTRSTDGSKPIATQNNSKEPQNPAKQQSFLPLRIQTCNTNKLTTPHLRSTYEYVMCRLLWQSRSRPHPMVSPPPRRSDASLGALLPSPSAFSNSLRNSL